MVDNGGYQMWILVDTSGGSWWIPVGDPGGSWWIHVVNPVVTLAQRDVQKKCNLPPPSMHYRIKSTVTGIEISTDMKAHCRCGWKYVGQN